MRRVFLCGPPLLTVRPSPSQKMFCVLECTLECLHSVTVYYNKCKFWTFRVEESVWVKEQSCASQKVGLFEQVSGVHFVYLFV